jgi:hypothetical protein
MIKKLSVGNAMISRQHVAIFLLMVVVLFFLASCAAGPNKMEDSKNQKGKVAGFWAGLWHGFIALFTFIISLFSDSVSVYEVHNSGSWYNFGFILGVMIFFSGSGGGACKKSRSKKS